MKGQFTAILKYQDKQVTEEVYAVRRLNHSLLERSAIEALGLVQRVNAVQIVKTVSEALWRPRKAVG